MSNQVSITDLLTAIGSDNIKYQCLINCMENIKAGKGRTIITFGTDAITATDAALNTGPRALIIWVDGELMSQRLRELMAGELQANIPVVPDGWKLVPVEPTIEMVQAATHSAVGFGTRAAYQAMLAAAPKLGGE